MIIRKLRLQRSWSQQQLAEYSGLSIRTIQRLEKNQIPSEESAKCLAAVFEVDANELLACFTTQPKQEASMSSLEVTLAEQRAMREVEDLKDFYQHAMVYMVVIPFLWIVNWLTSPGYWWAAWSTVGWGFGLALHAVTALGLFHLFSPEWEKRQIEKRLNR
ncbi:MAG: helix-turn-helix domain-containing protein [Oceanospirillaceae bacterium]|nr:helix-turn-helix domain-containing protein [Oceanospirillaceae bacterium]